MPKKYPENRFLSKVNPHPTAQSDYDKYYLQFVDAKKPLSELEDDDMQGWVDADATHPPLSEHPDPNRTDYFDVPYGIDPAQKLDIHRLNGDQLRPVIYYIHGGGWISGDKNESRYAGPTWISLGYTIVYINYRLTSQCPHPAQIDDCARALRWVIDNIDQYGGDPNNIAIAGHSAGGHLAALLACGTKWKKQYGIDMSKIKCSIFMSGVYDFHLMENYYQSLMPAFIAPLLGTAVAEDKDDTSPVLHVTGSEPRSLILHGGADWLVPKTNATRLYEQMQQRFTDVELEIVEHYWHCQTIVSYGDTGHKPTKIVNKFLAKHLPTDKNKA